MDERSRVMIVVILLIAEAPAKGHTLDVCGTCHFNAKCESNGSEKVCTCKYGFIGNGITRCQDKDECQMGANKICGQHTTCQNTYGSYYCTCLAGYITSNNKAVFIPNDGTHCQDNDECRIRNVCGEGAQCRNFDGSFDCSCQLGYQVHNGVEPFNPLTDTASCEEVDCGQPASVEDAVLLSVTGTTYGSVVMFVCDEGFVCRSGDGRSFCGADGLWSRATMVCEEVDCGSPPALPHSHMLWNKSSRMGTEVVYQCNSGYHNVGKGNVSICTSAGQWERPSIRCQEAVCGSPPVIESTEQVWDSHSTPGSTVLYVCKEGFYNKGGLNISTCNENAQWTLPTLLCQEVDCGSPPALLHSHMLWNKSSRMGTEVVYQCNSGYHNVGKGNVSICTSAGQWERPSIRCQDKDECQMGANKICGQHTTCQNTFGSYYCTCLAGYRTSNNKAFFIPNDGTHCQDNDECRFRDVCGVRAQCRNFDGSFDCSCQLGYQVHNGVEPFNPLTDTASCEEVDCGQPASVEDAVLLSVTGTTYGSVVMFVCDEGFVCRSGDGRSVCGADGLWSRATMVCEEVDCGSPPALPHSHMLWNKSSRMGTEVVYQCNSGYHNVGKGNVSICTSAGQWERPSIRCQDILCGDPPTLPHTGRVWIGSSSPGSTVTYYCKIGFYHSEGNNMSLCSVNGYWTQPNISCKEISCGRPLTLPHTNLRWDGTSRPGSVVLYECMDGFDQMSGNNSSTCLLSGQWGNVSVKCKGTSYVLRVSFLSAALSIVLVAMVILGGCCFTWFIKRT